MSVVVSPGMLLTQLLVSVTELVNLELVNVQVTPSRVGHRELPAVTGIICPPLLQPSDDV